MLTSSNRLATHGPRSVTSSTSDRAFNRLVTLIRVPNGSLRWAQVKAFMSKGCPLAVGSPWNSGPYQLATPNCAVALAAVFDCSTFSSGGLASDRAESTTRAATAQPKTRFLNSRLPSVPPPGELAPDVPRRTRPVYDGSSLGGPESRVKLNCYLRLPDGRSANARNFQTIWTVIRVQPEHRLPQPPYSAAAPSPANGQPLCHESLLGWPREGYTNGSGLAPASFLARISSVFYFQRDR